MSRSVFRSARTISLLTLASRLLGMVRDMACSYAFGVGGVWSAFTVGFQVPNLFRRLFGEGALSAASIPVLTETRTREGDEAVDRLSGRLVGVLMVVLAVLLVLGELVIGVLYYFYHDRPEAALTLGLSALLLPFMWMICVAAILGGIQNIFNKFALPAAMPIVLNIFMIAAALGGTWLFADLGDPKRLRWGVVLLALSVLAAGMVQVVWQWRGVQNCGLKLRPSLQYRDPSLKRIALTMLPMLVGLGAVQINTLADSLIAWWFVKEQIVAGGSGQRVGPSILYFAQRLYQFPLGVFAIALATAIFPAMSRRAAENDHPGLGKTLADGMRVTGFIAAACTVGLILAREPLVRVLYGRGEFMEWSEAGDRVAAALLWYSLGIWAYAVNHLVVRAFYALGEARTPMKVAAYNVVINLVMNLLLVQTGLKEGGLALATSVCATLQAAVMLVIFQRRIGHVMWGQVVSSALRSAAAAVVMGLAVWAVDRCVMGDQRAIVRLLAMVAVGMVSFFVAAIVFRCKEIRDLMKR